MPNRGSLNTFAGQGFPIHWLATSESRVNLQPLRRAKKRQTLRLPKMTEIAPKPDNLRDIG